MSLTKVGNVMEKDAKGFGITISSGVDILTGTKGYAIIPYSGTITGWTLVANGAGELVIDLWKDTYANFPPTIADTITGTEKPTLSAVSKNQDTSLSTWTTSVTEGDIIAFRVESCTSINNFTLYIRMVGV